MQRMIAERLGIACDACLVLGLGHDLVQVFRQHTDRFDVDAGAGDQAVKRVDECVGAVTAADSLCKHLQRRIHIGT